MHCKTLKTETVLNFMYHVCSLAQYSYIIQFDVVSAHDGTAVVAMVMTRGKHVYWHCRGL